MTASIIRSSLASGVAMASVAGFVLAPAAPQTLLTRPKPVVALTAQVAPLAAQTPSALVHDIPDLINQQVSFHVAFVADFVGTGAVLVDRQLQIPGTLVRDIQNGTPLPVAVGRALQTFVEIELDAGRELVGFAVQYIDFQIRFLAQVVNDVITASASMFAAVGDVIAPKVAAAAPTTRLAEAPSVPEAQPSDVAPDKDPESETRVAHSARRTMSLSTPDDKTTGSAQGEIRRGSSETTTPATEAASDEDAPTHRDDTTDQSEAPSAEPEQQQPDVTETDAHQQDTASMGDDASDADQSDSASGDQ